MRLSSSSVSRSVMSDSLQPHKLYPARLLCPWDSAGKNTGVGCHSPLQRIVPTQGSNQHLLHCRQILYDLSHKGDPLCLRISKRRKIFSLLAWLKSETYAYMMVPEGDSFKPSVLRNSGGSSQIWDQSLVIVVRRLVTFLGVGVGGAHFRGQATFSVSFFLS